MVLITLKATDQDLGENGRVTYYLKVGNKNVHETSEFHLDETSGELRTKIFLDREQKDSYQVNFSLFSINHRSLMKILITNHYFSWCLSLRIKVLLLDSNQ